MTGPAGGRAADEGPAGAPEAGAPYLRVVRGEPTGAELAALVAVVAVLAARLASESTVERPAARSTWADPARRLRAVPLPGPGPGAWRRSGLPG